VSSRSTLLERIIDQNIYMPKCTELIDQALPMGLIVYSHTLADEYVYVSVYVMSVKSPFSLFGDGVLRWIL